MYKERCACCGCDCSREQWMSSLFNPRNEDLVLCEYCGEQEEKAIEDAGTNDIPWLLATYERTA